MPHRLEGTQMVDETTVMVSRDLSRKAMSKLVRENVDTTDSVLITDEFSGYDDIIRFMSHEVVNHSKTYVSGIWHTNTLEGFWSLFKRGFFGQYHQLSKKTTTEKSDSAQRATTKAITKTGPGSKITADYVGKINIMGFELGCAVLSNERRVFFQREVLGALTGKRKGNMARYLKADNLRPYVPEKFAGDKWDENILKFEYSGNIALAVLLIGG